VLFTLLGFWPVGLVFGIVAPSWLSFSAIHAGYHRPDSSLVVSPADGRVTRVRPVADGSEGSATVGQHLFVAARCAHQSFADRR